MMKMINKPNGTLNFIPPEQPFTMTQTNPSTFKFHPGKIGTSHCPNCQGLLDMVLEQSGRGVGFLLMLISNFRRCDTY